MALFLWPNQNLRDLVIETINSARLVPRSGARSLETAAGTVE